MTLLEDARRRRLPGEPVSPSSRPSGWSCARRVLEDAKALAALANDRRIAENTARIPHPYTLADAERLHTLGQQGGDGETAFLITRATAR